MKGQRRTYLYKTLISALVCILFVSMVIGIKPRYAYAESYDPNTGYKELGIRFWEDQKPDVGFYINAGNRYILETVKEPVISSTGGEWSVMDLLRGMYIGGDYINYVPENYFSDYLGRVEEQTEKVKGIYHRVKYTEYDRLTLALTSLGYGISNVAGYDYQVICSVKNSTLYRQGINGPIWILIALNTCNNYRFYTRAELEAGLDGTDAVMQKKLEKFNIKSLEAESQTINDKNGQISPKGVSTEGKQIDYILSREIKDTEGNIGGWALYGNTPDPDITGMALQALAPYYLSKDKFEKAYGPDDSKNYTYEDLCKAVERAILVLSKIQKPNGGYDSWGSINAESISQVIVALTELGIDPMSNSISLPHIGESCSFIKEGGVMDGTYSNNMIDAILAFWDKESGSAPEVGGFKHVTAGNDGGGGSGTTVNAMATDQAVYGLIAYDRFVKHKNSLYNMNDMCNGEYKDMKALNHKIVYDYQGLKDNMESSAYAYQVITIPLVDKINDVSFKGWNSKADGTGTSYKEGDLLSMPDKDITLYAQFDIPEYTLSLNTNGGKLKTQVPSTFTMITPTFNLPDKETIAKDNYLFDGWYDNEDFSGEAYTSIKKGTTKNVELYAKWELDLEPVKNVEKMIDGLGTITLDKKESVQLARKAYDELIDEQKKLVENYNVLEDAEKKLSSLEEEKEQDKVNNEDKDKENSTVDSPDMGTSMAPSTGDNTRIYLYIFIALSMLFAIAFVTKKMRNIKE